MKRIILSTVAGLSVVASMACGAFTLPGLPGGVGQSKECKDYVACAEKVSPGTMATNNTSFGPSGSCWQVQASADQCTATCKTGNDAYKSNGDAQAKGCTF